MIIGSRAGRNKIGRILQRLTLAAGAVILGGWLAWQAPAGKAISPLPPEDARVDREVISALQAGGAADFVLVMGEQADLSPAYQITDWVERGWYVLKALKATASRSQGRVTAELNRRGLQFRSFFAGNEIYVYGGDTLALQVVMSFPEVMRVRAPAHASIEPVGYRLRIYGPAAPQAQIQNAIDWGITDTRASDFWSAFANTGEGILVANLDTGVDVNHPALAGAYRCASGNLTDPVCWFDATGACNGQVCDDQGHGTHTMGTMVASNDPALPHTVGMAPGAEWIACKACTKDGNCADPELLECADWILAPGGDPANRPQVVNNSWGDVGGNDWFAAKVSAWHAAGIFPAFSAGNFGSCSSLGSPGDYPESFSSAAHKSDRSIASFSSKGPGAFGDSPYTKPNLSAPGQAILSTYPTDLQPSDPWAYMNGTSMASPHSAGAVALLWSCAPLLKGQINATFQLLQFAADLPPAGACGTPASGQGNYTFGYGYLNVLAAGDLICTTGQVEGVVSDATSGAPLAGAEITFSNGIQSPVTTTTQGDGSYDLMLPQGNYTLDVKAYAYLPQLRADVQVLDDQISIQDFQITPAAQIEVSGVVRDGSGYASLLAAQLTYTSLGHQLQAQTDPASGAYAIQLYQQNEYQVLVEAIGLDYLPMNDAITPAVSPLVRDYALLVNPETCTVPGYTRFGGVSQTFDSPSLPASWTVEDHAGTGQVWGFSDPGFRGNRTGGSGGFASVDALYYGTGPQDTSLVTPLLNFVPAQNVSLSFKTAYRINTLLQPPSTASVELSLDGGSTWNAVWPHANQDFTDAVNLDLSSQAAGQPAVRLRFHYTNSSGDGWWQVDDVAVTPPPGCLALKYRIILFPIMLNAVP